MITAKRTHRINVWPETGFAIAAAHGDANVSGRMTVWRTEQLARNNMVYNPGGSGPAPGGGDPEADIIADFKSGSYSIDGSTSAITDIFFEEAAGDPDGWPFDPTGIVNGSGFPVTAPSGPTKQFPRLVDALATSLVVSGYTVRVTMVVENDPDNVPLNALFDWETYDETYDNNVFALFGSLQAGFIGDGNSSTSLPQLPSGRHVAAFTLAPANYESISIDGESVVSNGAASVPSTIKYIGFIFNKSNTNAAPPQYVEKIEIFRSPVPAVNLPALCS